MAQQAVAPRMEAEGAKEEEVGMEVVVVVAVVEGAEEEEEEEEEDGVEEVGVEVPVVEVMEDPQLLILARWSTCLIQMMVWRSSLNSDFL